MLNFTQTVHQMKGEEHSSPRLYLHAQTTFCSAERNTPQSCRTECSVIPRGQELGCRRAAKVLTLGSSFHQTGDIEALKRQ